MQKYIFGPVPSRRFGASLGIDIVPPKYCTLDCIYCQIGRTTNLILRRKKYVAVSPILNELKKYLKSKTKIDCITFSGSGEPTLNSNIGKMISEIKKIALCSTTGKKIPVVVITNGTLLFMKSVRNDLLKADVVAPSLDAILNFHKINRPHKSLDIKKIIDGLVEFRKIYKGKIWLEVMFVKNINDSNEDIEELKKAIEQIKPDKIHLNTVVRPPAENYAKLLEYKKLLKIKKLFGKNCEIISNENGENGQKNEMGQIGTDIQQKILEILKRRPMRLIDLKKISKETHHSHLSSQQSAKKYEVIQKELWVLERKKKIALRNGWWVLI
ncbi:MAG: radical SAM protein [Elusimicrobiota bacterium]